MLLGIQYLHEGAKELEVELQKLDKREACGLLAHHDSTSMTENDGKEQKVHFMLITIQLLENVKLLRYWFIRLASMVQVNVNYLNLRKRKLCYFAR